ncbi:MAG: DUF354 domain-containing protein [Spartobacteria bacterium]|nr:DUF354 domain-containing protein [Spartobacteria bacterium]
MKVLIDLQHPAHLHFFRHAARRLQAEGHEVRFTGRNKDILEELAQHLDIPVEVFGTARKGVVNLARELCYRQWKLWQYTRAFKPDVIMAIAGTCVSAVGRLRGVPTYIFYDTEHATLSNLVAYPFATCIYVPRCYRKSIRWNHKRYNGYHELAYLHPHYFTPDPTVLREAGVAEGELFSIMRMVNWGAAHDLGYEGFSPANLTWAVETLAKHGRVFISCEGEMPAPLEPYRLRVDVTRAHDLMAYAALIFGESATMCSEGAVLGVPGIYMDPVGRGYTDEQEREYGLVFNYTSRTQHLAIQKADEILTGYDRETWREKGRRLVADKVDVSELIYQVAIAHA